MQNVAPSRALVRRSYQLLQLAFVLTSIGIFLAVVGLALFVVPLTSEGSRSANAYEWIRTGLLCLGVLLGLGSVGLAIRAFTYKTDNTRARLVGETIAPRIDEKFTYIRNVSRWGLGYIDAVLVGPPGVLVFRILDKEGTFLNEGGRWMQWDGQDWAVAKIDPTREVVEDIKKIREYTEKRGLDDVAVFGVIVFIKDDPIVHLTIKEPVVRPTHLSSLITRLNESYLAKDRIDTRTVRELVDMLYVR
jgi:hypothetical protein